MKPGHPNRFRTRLLAAAVCPLAVAVVAVAVPPDSPLVPIVLGAGFVFAAIAAGALWTLSRPLAELVDAVDQIADAEAEPELPTARNDELGRIAVRISELLERIAAADQRAEEAEQATEVANRRTEDANRRTDSVRAELADHQNRFATALSQLSENIGQVANGTAVTPLALNLPPTVSGDAVTAAVADLTAKVTTVRQRLTGFVRVLQTFPNPVLITDDRGNIRFANTAAEQALRRPVAELTRTTLASHFRQPAVPDPSGLPSISESGMLAWLAEGGRTVAAESTNRIVLFALTAARSGSQTAPIWCVTFRELTEDHHRLGTALARTREEAFANTLALADRSVGDAGGMILAQTRQLLCEAKQSQQRDALVPKLRTVQLTAGDLDAQARVTRWLAVVLWGQLPPPARVEFLASESVRSVVDQLDARLKTRNATVTVTDQGGWVYCDEEWLRTAVHGALAHAVASVKDGPIGVKLRRLPCDPGERDGRLEIEILDAGPALTPTELAAITQPFGGIDPTAFLPTPGADGYLPGLLLAGRMAAALGGSMTLDATASERLIVRLVVPTRLPDQADLTPVGSNGKQPDVGHPEELCMGWKLGTAC